MIIKTKDVVTNRVLFYAGNGLYTHNQYEAFYFVDFQSAKRQAGVIAQSSQIGSVIEVFDMYNCADETCLLSFTV